MIRFIWEKIKSVSMGRRIAVIGGTGNEGFGIALRLAKAGEQVIIGSRDKGKADESVQKIMSMVPRAKIEGMENGQAAKNSNIVFLAIPLPALQSIANSIRSSLHDNQIVVDVSNPLESYVGGDFRKPINLFQGSVIETVENWIQKKVKMVKAFNYVVSGALREIDKDLDFDVIVCSDYDDAKREVMQLIEKIPKLHPVDGGSLENSRLVEQITPLLLGIASRKGVQYVGLRIP